MSKSNVDLPLGPRIRSAYNYDRTANSRSSGIVFDPKEEPSYTVQSQRDEADINVIVRRFGVTGPFPVPKRLPSFGDFSEVQDFQSAMNAVRSAQENFMSMPAKLRAKFHNDPQEFLEFVSDPDNQDEMVKLGLAEKPKKEENAGGGNNATSGGEGDGKVKAGGAATASAQGGEGAAGVGK